MKPSWIALAGDGVGKVSSRLWTLKQARGLPFVISWAHRISGVLLSVFLVAHIFTLSSLVRPDDYNATMRIVGSFPLVFFEWALAVVVIFHSLNGARLLVYEGLSTVWDPWLRRWVLLLSVAYGVLLGWFMAMGDQSVSYKFFWVVALFFSWASFAVIFPRFWRGYLPLGWRLQRVSAGILLVLVPAHMLFMHLNYPVGHEATVVLERLRGFLAKGIDGLILLCALYHGAYGIFSIASDYLPLRTIRLLVGLLLWIISVFLGWVGLKVLALMGG